MRAYMRVCHTLQFVYYTCLSLAMFSNLIEIFQIVLTNFFVSLDAFNEQKKCDFFKFNVLKKTLSMWNLCWFGTS